MLTRGGRKLSRDAAWASGIARAPGEQNHPAAMREAAAVPLSRPYIATASTLRAGRAGAAAWPNPPAGFHAAAG